MSAYRTNANQVPSVDVIGRKIHTAEYPINDVEVEFWYDFSGGAKSIIERIDGDQSPEKVLERHDEPAPYLARSGEQKLTSILTDAGKSGVLWINDDFCVPWSRVFSITIKKRFERIFRMHYVLITGYGN